MANKKSTSGETVNETADQGVDLRPLPMAPACGPGSVLVGIHPIHDQVELPEYKTDAAGCFDLQADLSTHHAFLKHWDPVMNREGQRKVRDDSTGRHILLEPGERILIPTGLIFVFPVGFSMNTFIRSSVALKKGLALANSVGYIDEDYRDELFLPIINTSRGQVRIDHKERLAQGEVRPAIQAIIDVVDERPSLAGNRIGGFGSTGNK